MKRIPIEYLDNGRVYRDIVKATKQYFDAQGTIPDPIKKSVTEDREDALEYMLSIIMMAGLRHKYLADLRAYFVEKKIILRKSELEKALEIAGTYAKDIANANAYADPVEQELARRAMAEKPYFEPIFADEITIEDGEDAETE